MNNEEHEDRLKEANSVELTADKVYSKESINETTKNLISKIPLLKTRASPLDKDTWNLRVKEELQALIVYVKLLQEGSDKRWFALNINSDGKGFEGHCWYYHQSLRYQFKFFLDIPVGYPNVSPDIRIPELEGKTIKMFHGAKICLSMLFYYILCVHVTHLLLQLLIFILYGLEMFHGLVLHIY